jgi:hypothetical protein
VTANGENTGKGPQQRGDKTRAEVRAAYTAVNRPPGSAGGSEPEASAAERQAAAAAMAEWMLSDPSVHPLQTGLQCLMDALMRSGDAAVAEPLAAVKDALAMALDDRLDREGLQTLLDLWAEATGGPCITIAVVKG